MEQKKPKRPPFLPQELIEEIFSKLPAKALLKFRCLSKPWRSVIDSKRFVKIHLQNSTHSRVIMNYPDKLKQSCESTLDDPINKVLKSPRIIGCCNGLVCVFELSERCFILWNPSTRRFKKLPKVDLEIKGNWYVVYRHLRWNEASDEYIVLVCLWLVDKLVHKQYSSKTNSWETMNISEIHIEDGALDARIMEDTGLHTDLFFEMKAFPREFHHVESLVSPTN